MASRNGRLAVDMTNRALRMKSPLLAAGTAVLIVAMAGPAQAARTFVREIEARAAVPAPPGATFLNATALSACLTRAQGLEKAGTQLDHDGAEIDRLAATAALMGRGIDLNSALAPDDNENGADSMAKLHKRFMDYDAMAVRFQNASKAHQVKLAEYDARVHAFDAECDKPFRAEDLTEAKRALGWK
jgi:hypothetical protein